MSEEQRAKWIITGIVWLQICIAIGVFYLITHTIYPIGIAFLSAIGAIITHGVWSEHKK